MRRPRERNEVIKKLITKLGLSDKEVARLAGVSEAFVKKIRAAWRKKK